jgi:hypothetical protein
MLLLPILACSVGESILAGGGNPFVVGQAFAEHAKICAVCGNDAFAMVDDLEGQG